MERDWDMEWAVMYWMDTVTQEPHNRYQEYPDCIKDGVTLCKLMNILDPGCIVSSEGQGTVSATARVELFRAAIREYGVPEVDMFEAKDLLEKQNIPAVTRCIQVLAELAQQRGFQGPELGTTMPNECRSQFYSHMPKIFH